MNGCTFAFRNQGIRGFLNPIMEKRVTVLPINNESGANCLFQTHVQFILGLSSNPGEVRKFCRLPQASELSQSFLRATRQAMQFGRHEFTEIVRVLIGANTTTGPSSGGVRGSAP